MNLLRIQDALKNASDQQLMAMMQAPDSTAPSYLVLSELRRRKDMRQKQETGGGPQSTVAEELTAPQQQPREPVGIRGLQQAPVDPDGVDAQDGGDVQAMSGGGIANVRHYAEGGPVRMQTGGDVSSMSLDELRRLLGQMSDPRFAPSGITANPIEIRRRIADLEQAEEDAMARAPRSRLRQDVGAVGGALHGAAGAVGGALSDVVSGTGGALAGVGRAAVQYATEPVAPPMADIFRGRMPEDVPARLPPVASLGPAQQAADGSEQYGPSAPEGYGAPSNQYGPPAPDGYGPAAQPTERPAALPPQGTGEGESTRPPTADGIRGLSAARGGAGGSGGGGATGADGLPTLAEVYRRNAELFPDTMGGIRQRMQEGRIDPAARRQEAVNMALIEAGLRIAGSRNPSLIGAIGEGALPAVQGYGQQLGQIRSEQRQALRDDLELAKQEVNRQYAIGQISAAEHRSRMEILSRQQQAARAEAGADRRAARSEAAADRRFTQQAALAAEQDRRRGNISYEEYMRMTPEQRQAFEATRTINRPADVSGLAPVLNAAERRLTELRAEFDNLPSAPSQSSWGSPNPRYTEWVRRRDELRSRISQAENRVRELENTFYYGRGATQQNRTPSATAPTDSSNRPPIASFAGQ